MPRYTWAGTVGALLFGAASFTPSLLPRAGSVRGWGDEPDGAPDVRDQTVPYPVPWVLILGAPLGGWLFWFLFVREAARWYLIDQGHGKYNWETVQPIVDAANKRGVTIIW